MKIEHEKNLVKFDRLLGGEQRAKAAIEALAVKMHGHGRKWVTQKNLAIAVLALEGNTEAASQPEGIAIREILNVMGPVIVSKAPTISRPPAQAIQRLAKSSAASKKEAAFQLLEEYGLLDNRRERAAFTKDHSGALKDPESGVTKTVLRYMETGKDVPPIAMAGMYFTTT